MTYVECASSECDLPRNNNTFYTITGTEDKYYWPTDDTDVSLFGSSIVPILIEIAKRVNYSVHLYVNTGSQRAEKNFSDFQKHTLQIAERIDAYDRTPIIYDYDTEIMKYECVKPLYISNQITMLSAVRNQQTPTIVYFMWNIFDSKVWFIILMFFLFNAILHAFAYNRKLTANSIAGSVWTYLPTLLGKSGRIRSFNAVYLFWILTVMPLIRIFQKNLLANIVANPSVGQINNIDDLLDPQLDTYMNGNDLNTYREENYQMLIKDTEFRNKFTKLVNKSKALDFANLAIGYKPEDINNLLKSFVLIEDEYAIEIFQSLLSRYVQVETGREKYIDKLVTPFCSRPNFPFPDLAQNISVRLFETSILSYWSSIKTFYGICSTNLVIDTFAADIRQNFYSLDACHTEINLFNTRYFFVLVSYSLAFSFVLLCGELIYARFKVLILK